MARTTIKSNPHIHFQDRGISLVRVFSCLESMPPDRELDALRLANLDGGVSILRRQ